MKLSSKDGKQTKPFVSYGLLYGVSAFVLCALIWEYPRLQVKNWFVIELVIPVIIYAGLTILFERCLAESALTQSWQYRMAFFASAGFAILQFIASSQFQLGSTAQNINSRVTIFSLMSAMVGAFFGGLLSTAIHTSLWEDNAPPSPEVCAAVQNIHEKIIGTTYHRSISKRTFDLILAFCGLILSTPIWLASIFLIWINEPGPILFVKNSVGRGGKNFHQLKLRTMIAQAEKDTGPVLAQESDSRTLWFGRFLRKTALDELPQLINILMGEMSFVGPRPQRTVLVYDYLQTMPEYAERHRVRPGIAGLAQVAGDYYLTPRQKLRFDRLYINYANLGFDLKLLILAFSITFYYRWRKDWNGRLPRSLL